MSRKTIVIGAVCLLIIIALGIFAYTRKAHVPTDLLKANPTEKGLVNSLQALLSSRATQKCAFSQIVKGSSRTGTVYMTDGEMRGDFTISNGARSAHMLTDGREARFWADNGEPGVVIKYRNGEPNVSDVPDTINLASAIEYSCESWTPDDALLLPPTDVIFKTAESLIPDTPSVGTMATSTSEGIELSTSTPQEKLEVS